MRVMSNHQFADFWFNYFNVSVATGLTRDYILPKENDGRRKNAFRNFRLIFEATTKSPAMLFYLSNAESAADTHLRINNDVIHFPGWKGKKFKLMKS